MIFHHIPDLLLISGLVIIRRFKDFDKLIHSGADYQAVFSAVEIECKVVAVKCLGDIGKYLILCH